MSKRNVLSVSGAGLATVRTTDGFTVEFDTAPSCPGGSDYDAGPISTKIKIGEFVMVRSGDHLVINSDSTTMKLVIS